MRPLRPRASHFVCPAAETLKIALAMSRVSRISLFTSLLFILYASRQTTLAATTTATAMGHNKSKEQQQSQLIMPVSCANE